MKREQLFFLVVSLTGILILNSCKKKFQCQGCPGNNQYPVAKAGADQVITLPINSSTLDAGTSIDPDGTIVQYAWAQLSGPNQSSFVNSNTVTFSITNLIQGTYMYQLTVTDNGGLIARDTVLITVLPALFNRPVLSVKMVAFGTLSQAREDIYTATAGSKILFAGGILQGNIASSRVDIYDFENNTWSTAELSVGRGGMTVTTVGNKIIFAGGVDQFNGIKYHHVDIYDATTNTWSTAQLSSGRGYLASASIGDKAFFAGGWYWLNRGFYLNTVDIYNSLTNTWSVTSLSEAREGLTATTAGNKIYFAGGSVSEVSVSNKIDIYDNASNSWSTSNRFEGTQSGGNIAVSNKIYWAGGYKSLNPQKPSSLVEIKDINTQASTFASLSQEKGGFNTVVKGNDIVFFVDLISADPLGFDVFNTVSGTWSVGRLPIHYTSPCIISANSNLYVAGGKLNGVLSNQVYILEW